MSEDSQPGAGPDAPVSPDTTVSSDAPVSSEMPVGPGPGQEVELTKGTKLSDRVAGHLADQARLTAQGYKARRVTTEGDQPGMADLTPLRELVAELREEARNVRLRERIGRALRQAADVIDPPSG
jgi:hypothetical protein